MAFDSNTDDRSGTFAPMAQPPSPTGPYAPLPPSRRQRDIGIQWVVVLITLAVSAVAAAMVLAHRPSESPVYTPRQPVGTEQTCTYRYLDCDDATTTGWPR